jgi:hypothetical protein
MLMHFYRLPIATLCAAIFFLLLLCASPYAMIAHAQDLDNVTISGRIVDERGDVVAGATVTVELEATSVKRSVTTNEEGQYRFIQLEPGTYTLTVPPYTGFEEFVVPNLTLVAGQNLQQNLTLFVPSAIVDQHMIVDVDTPIVDTTRTVVGGTVTTEEIESLPVSSRSPLDLIFTLGGVTEEPLSTRDLAEDRNTTNQQTPEEVGTFALSGSPAYSNNITIDGLDNNDDRAARERFQPSIEAVEEVQVITNQFSAEYGRASGGRINIRTRGGSNEYRGRLFYFHRNQHLNANTFRNNTLGLARLPLNEQNPGFTLSGPVRLPWFLGGRGGRGREKNRTFFFAAYEYDTLLESALVDTLCRFPHKVKFTSHKMK